MLHIRNSADRGHYDLGWLDTRHTFSFGEYYDPEHMGFRSLRVINDDIVKPGQGFGTHGHRDMEIVTYVIDGALEHKDSMGTGSVLRPGDVQRMSAGRGVTHSEFNHSRTEPLHLLQIWLLPREMGSEPSYQEKKFAQEEKRDQLRLIVSPDGDQGSLVIHQDVRLYAGVLRNDARVEASLDADRHAWLQVVHGRIDVNGVELGTGDGAAISEERELKIRSLGASEILLFDLN